MKVELKFEKEYSYRWDKESVDIELAGNPKIVDTLVEAIRKAMEKFSDWREV